MSEYKIVVETENGEEYTHNGSFDSRQEAAEELNDILMHAAYIEGSQIVDGRIVKD